MGPCKNFMKSYAKKMRRIAIMIHLPTIYIFIPVSGYVDCVGRDPSVLLCPGNYNAGGTIPFSSEICTFFLYLS